MLAFRPVVCLMCGSTFNKRDSAIMKVEGDEVRVVDDSGMGGGNWTCSRCSEEHQLFFSEGKLLLELRAVRPGYTGQRAKTMAPSMASGAQQNAPSMFMPQKRWWQFWKA